MSRPNPLRLKIASPCKADWNAMTGDDAVRHCGMCDKSVYNLSEMTNAQVEALLKRAGDTPCVRFYQRHDGTVLTGDCPVGAKAVRRKRTLAGIGAGALAAFGLALAPGLSSMLAGGGDSPEPLVGATPIGELMVEPLTEPVDQPIADPDDGPGFEPDPDERMGRVMLGEPSLPPDVER